MGSVWDSFIFSCTVALVPLGLHLAHKPAVPGQRGLSSSTAAEFDRACPAQSCSSWGGLWWGLTAGSWGGSLGGQSRAAGLVAGSMDISLSLVAREASQGLSPGLNGFPRPAPPKTTKKPKKAVLFFEVEILDAKTREKLCFLDKVGPWCLWHPANDPANDPSSSQPRSHPALCTPPLPFRGHRRSAVDMGIKRAVVAPGCAWEQASWRGRKQGKLSRACGLC